MLKKILMFTLPLVSISAMADWKSFATTTSTAEYIDLNTIVNTTSGTKEVLKLSDLRAYALPSGKTFRSSKMKYEMNCSDQKIRVNSLTSYDGQMGKGQVVTEVTNTKGEWDTAPPNSLNKLLLSIVCVQK